MLTGRRRRLSHAAKTGSIFPRPLGWDRHAHRLFVEEEGDGGASAYAVLDERGVRVAQFGVPGMLVSAALSPDQSRVLFTLYPTVAGPRPVLTARSAIQPSRVLSTIQMAPHHSPSGSALWSPDGGAFAYGSTALSGMAGGSARASFQVRITDATTGRTRTIGTLPGFNNRLLLWSPDSSALLVDRFDPQEVRNGHDTFLLMATNGRGSQSVPEPLAAALSAGQRVVGWSSSSPVVPAAPSPAPSVWMDVRVRIRIGRITARGGMADIATGIGSRERLATCGDAPRLL